MCLTAFTYMIIQHNRNSRCKRSAILQTKEK